MTDFPPVQPSVVAELTEKAPGRIRKKVDKNPEAAKDWDWSFAADVWSIAAGEQTVSLKVTNGQVLGVDDVSCSCLLSPRCVHVLSCLVILPVADAAPATDGEEVSDEEDPEVDEFASFAVVPRAKRAAEQMWDVAAELLSVGGNSMGALQQAQLLRAIHECRSEGLHRIANAGTRVIESTRILRDKSDQFRADDYVEEILELMLVSKKAMVDNELSLEWLGTARRRYRPVPSLKVYGLFAEPILTRTGYSGVVTYVMDDEGRCWSLSNVRPGDSSRIAGAWRAGIDVGQSSVTHHQLARGGLLLQQTSCSPDGRLGSGQDCRAVPVSGRNWNEDPLSTRFAESLDDQLDRAFSWLDRSSLHRPPDWDLVFLEGQVLGSVPEGIVFQSDGQSLILRSANRAAPLRFNENVEVLQEAAGTHIKVIARIDTARSGEAGLLALGPAGKNDGDPDLHLPESWNQIANLGLDALQGSYFRSFRKSGDQFEVPASVDDGLDVFLRRIRAVVLGGRHSLPTRAVNSVARDVRRLEQAFYPTAARLLEGLVRAAVATKQDLEGRRFPDNAHELAENWAAATLYLQSARRTLQRQRWKQREG